MAQITKTVDKTLVTGSEIFVYSVNVSYSGLSQPSENGYLIDFFPSKIKFVLPQIGGQIKSITQIPVAGGTNVRFDFGAVSAGTSLSFTIACSFGPGRVDNDSFINAAALFADQIQVATGVAPIVNLTLVPLFNLTKNTLNPIVRPNDIVTMTLILANNGDAGSTITNVVINDTLPLGLTPDTSFAPVGNDIPSNGYSDPTYNGRVGSWTQNILQFDLPSFSGVYYSITFKVKVDSNVVAGQQIINTALWTVNGIPRPNALLHLAVFTPANAFTLTKTGVRTGIAGNPGSPVNFSIVNTNIDIVDHSNYTLLDEIPPELDINRLTFVMNNIGMPSYSIQISLRSAPNNNIVVIANANTTVTNFSLTPYIPAGDGVARIIITAPILYSGKPNTHTLIIFGFVNSTAQLNQTVVNKSTASADGITVESLWALIINGASDLSVVKYFVPQQNAYFPLEEFETVITGGAVNTITDRPILADLMPNELRYIVDSEYFVYRNNFTGTEFDSRQPNFPIPLPAREIIPNFGGTGKILLRWKFDFVMPQGDNISVIFKNFVVIDPPNSFINHAYEGNPGKNILFVYDAIPDVNDYDGDGIVDEIISSRQVTGVILTTSEFSLKKLVKGQLDLDYSPVGKTVQGGLIDYQLLVTNNQQINLTDIEIVDILPYVGDKGVILTNQNRGSQFDVYATGAVEAEIINLLGDPVQPNPDIAIQYSISTDPIRFDQLGNTIGTGEWSDTPPPDITTLASVKVTTGASVILRPYERLIVTMHAKAPVGVSVSTIAYNSFAVRANKVIGSTIEPMLPTEPNKVGVQIISDSLGGIGQFVWEDYNKDGIWQPNEPGVNGITVELYDQLMNLLASTVTANNVGGEAGYYYFGNLPQGMYYVRFVTMPPYTITVQNLQDPNGSRPNPTDGITPAIVLLPSQVLLDVNAGLIGEPCEYPIIIAGNKCIHVGASFDPMHGVAAYDCNGNDITDNVAVVSNTVDTGKEGLYAVQYSVKDYRSQQTDLTIQVVVCRGSSRQAAITDLIQSVALQQAGLAHIMNAEAEKITKAGSLDFTDQQMLQINNSVAALSASITSLVIVMTNKANICDAQICGGDCCDGFEQSE